MSAAQEVITASEVAAAHQQRTSLVEKFARKYGLEPNRMMATLKATAFKGEVSTEQMAALLIVADQHGLNPWTKEIYAFPSRAGIVPVVGVDGWARIINEHPQFNGMDFSYDKEEEAYTCTMHRKDRDHPITITEYMAECRRPTDPWNSHPRRMLRHKSMIQCARLAFSFAGIYDPDEAERVLAAEGAVDVTPAKDEKSKGKIGPKKLREYIEKIAAIVERQDGPGLLEILGELDNEEYLQIWGALRSWERSAFKKLETEAKAADCGVGLNNWALEVLKSCKDKVSADTAWSAIQKAYDENGEQPPAELEATYLDIKSELPDAKDAPYRPPPIEPTHLFIYTVRGVQGIGLNNYALEVLKTCKDKVSAETAWNAIQKAYDENGAQPPDELQATYLDIKSELPDAKDEPK